MFINTRLFESSNTQLPSTVRYVIEWLRIQDLTLCLHIIVSLFHDGTCLYLILHLLSVFWHDCVLICTVSIRLSFGCILCTGGFFFSIWLCPFILVSTRYIPSWSWFCTQFPFYNGLDSVLARSRRLPLDSLHKLLSHFEAKHISLRLSRI